MTSTEYMHIFQEMSFEMMKDILSFTESPRKAVPRLLEQIRELTGAKIVAVIKTPNSSSNQQTDTCEVMGVNPIRRTNNLNPDIYNKLMTLVKSEKKLLVISDNENESYYQWLQKKNIGLSILMPIITENVLLGSFLILDLPTKINLDLIIQGLENLSQIFSLTFRGSIFYMDMEEMVEQRTQSLQESEQQLKNAQRIAKIGNWLLEHKNKYLTCSEEVYKILEIDDNGIDLTYDNFREFIHPEDLNSLIQTSNNSFNDEISKFQVDHRLILKSGKLKYVHENFETTFNKDGIPLKTIGTIHDITDLKKIEIALKENEEKLRNIVENSTNLYYSHDIDHNLTYVSPQCYDFLQCSPEEAMRNWMHFASDNPINDLAYEHTMRAIETGERQPIYELELIGAKGKKIWVEANESPVVKDGKTVALVGSLTDITEKKKAKIELEKSQEKYRNILETTNDGFWLVDLNGKILDVNKAYCTMSGYSKEELLGLTVKDFRSQ